MRRIAEFASRNHIPYISLPLGIQKPKRSPVAALSLRAYPALSSVAIVVVTDPTPDKVARLLGLNLDFGTTKYSTC